MRIACAQVSPRTDGTEAALRDLSLLAAASAEQKAEILLTPEMYLTGYNIGASQVARLAQPKSDEFFQSVSQIARKNGLAILYGYPERGKDDAVYNAVQLVDSQGASVLNYRKTHLYGDVDREQFSPGDRRSAIVEFAGCKIALAICYDVEFPELMRAYARDGAELVLVPTANMAPFTGVATRLVPARAEENGIFVAYTNYVGAEGEFDYCGLSCVCGPDGTDMARAGTEETLVVAELDLNTIRANRKTATHLTDTRPEIYK